MSNDRKQLLRLECIRKPFLVVNDGPNAEPRVGPLDHTMVIEEAMETLRKRREYASMKVHKSLEALQFANSDAIYEQENLYLRAVTEYDGVNVLLKGLETDGSQTALERVEGRVEENSAS